MKSFNSKNNRAGAILVMTALLSTAIMAITAIVVDVGYLYFKRNELQTAVNAAWLAGNDRLMKIKTENPVLSEKNKESIKEHIVEVMKFNGFEANGQNRINCIIKDDKDLQISANCHVGLFFAKIIEVDSTTVAASRNTDSTLAGTADILPIVMPHGITKWNNDNTLSFQFFAKNGGFVEGNEYIIKPGQISDSSLLCQGITNFTATGTIINSEYQRNMTYGYTKSLDVNDKVNLGSIGFAKETEEAIRQRVASGTQHTKVIVPIGEISDEMASVCGYNADVFPIYNLKNSDSNSNTIVNACKIIGFAEFELLKESEYQRIGSDYKNGDEGTLGKIASGQIRGRFLGYLVNPNHIK